MKKKSLSDYSPQEIIESKKQHYYLCNSLDSCIIDYDNHFPIQFILTIFSGCNCYNYPNLYLHGSNRL